MLGLLGLLGLAAFGAFLDVPRAAEEDLPEEDTPGEGEDGAGTPAQGLEDFLGLDTAPLAGSAAAAAEDGDAADPVDAAPGGDPAASSAALAPLDPTLPAEPGPDISTPDLIGPTDPNAPQTVEQVPQEGEVLQPVPADPLELQPVGPSGGQDPDASPVWPEGSVATALPGGEGGGTLPGADEADALPGAEADDSLAGGEGDCSLFRWTADEGLTGVAGSDAPTSTEQVDGGQDTDPSDLRQFGEGDPEANEHEAETIEPGDETGDWIHGGDGAVIHDFDPERDRILVEYDAARHPDPVVTVETGALPGSSLVKLDGEPLVQVMGVSGLTPASVEMVASGG